MCIGQLKIYGLHLVSTFQEQAYRCSLLSEQFNQCYGGVMCFWSTSVKRLKLSKFFSEYDTQQLFAKFRTML